MTLSEELFEKLCRNSHAYCEPIPTAEGKRTADYRISLSGVEAIAEVKQIEPGDHERQLLASAADPDALGVISDIHLRIRKKFQKARKQLKNLSGGCLPTLFVLYDNTRGLSGMENEDFLQAMHGDELVEIYSTRVGSRPEVVGTFHTFNKKNSKVRKNLNTSISCFCRLLKSENDEPLLLLFHNEFATNPLPTEAARKIAFRQYTRPSSATNEYRNWVPL